MDKIDKLKRKGQKKLRNERQVRLEEIVMAQIRTEVMLANRSRECKENDKQETQIPDVFLRAFEEE